MLVSGLCKHIWCVESRLNITRRDRQLGQRHFYLNTDTGAETLKYVGESCANSTSALLFVCVITLTQIMYSTVVIAFVGP